MSAVELGEVTFRYAGATTDALAGVTLSVVAGEVCWLYGSPGAGASTLLLAAAGLAPRFTGGTISGRIRLLGADPHTPEGRVTLRGRVAYIGSVPDPQLSGVAATVWEEIAFGPANLQWPIERIRAAASDAADRLQIGHLLMRRPETLSGGEKQRVVFASLMAFGPSVWFLDEADSALDAEGRAVIAALILAERERGAAIVVAAEDADATVAVTERVVLLERGSVAYDGPPRALLSGELAWMRGPGGTSIAGLGRAAHERCGGPRFAPPWALDVGEAVTRWS